MTGGALNAPNSTIAVGPSGTGLMNVNGGNIIAKLIQLGGSDPAVNCRSAADW